MSHPSGQRPGELQFSDAVHETDGGIRGPQPVGNCVGFLSPYHSKYNPIERCWGILEAHWNGTLLNSVETVVEWARTMTWKGLRPVVQLLDNVYETGVRIAKKVFQKIEERWERDKFLPKYSVRIQPQPS